MKPKELEKSYRKKKHTYHAYIDNIKKRCKWDIYNIINATLVKNPYTSTFLKRFFTEDYQRFNKVVLFFKSTAQYYVKNFYLFVSYFVVLIIYKIYYKKTRKYDVSTIIDIFGLVDKTNQSGKFNENYLAGVYEVFEKHKHSYTMLLRLYGIGKNPFKLKRFFEILNEDKRDFIFEYELLSLFDFVNLLKMIMVYPFKTLRLLQQEKNEMDRLFNLSLIEDIRYCSFDSFTRYLLGKNLAQVDTLKKVYSWSEFQVVERSFNFAIRNNKKNVKLNALQFYLNYETYFCAFVDDLDSEMLSAPHKVYVNGKYYLQDRKKVEYDLGVSLRYKNVFLFQGVKEEKNTILLGSYIENDTKYIIESVGCLDNIIFKNHPAVDIKKFGKLPKNIMISNESIYKLFENAKIVIGTASGTAVEAVACGVSVIIIASRDNLTVNPLVEYGKGKIWDIAFSKDEVEIIYNKLLEYRSNNQEEIQKIALWYKENFFVEPSEERIVEIFIREERDAK